MSNAASRDGSPGECSEDFTTGCWHTWLAIKTLVDLNPAKAAGLKRDWRSRDHRRRRIPRGLRPLKLVRFRTDQAGSVGPVACTDRPEMLASLFRPMTVPTFDDVESAARQIAGAAHYTPFVTSRGVNERTGAEI